MKNKPLSIDEVKELIRANPGVTTKAIEEHFGCNHHKVHWAFRNLRHSAFLFRQVDKGTARYYEAEYAAANNIPEKIKAPTRSNAYYKQRAKVREEKQQLSGGKLSWVELNRLLTKLWPASIEV